MLKALSIGLDDVVILTQLEKLTAQITE